MHSILPAVKQVLEVEATMSEGWKHEEEPKAATGWIRTGKKGRRSGCALHESRTGDRSQFISENHLGNESLKRRLVSTRKEKLTQPYMLSYVYASCFSTRDVMNCYLLVLRCRGCSHETSQANGKDVVAYACDFNTLLRWQTHTFVAHPMMYIASLERDR